MSEHEAEIQVVENHKPADVMMPVIVNLGEQAEGKVILPVVVIYRQKSRMRLRPWF